MTSPNLQAILHQLDEQLAQSALRGTGRSVDHSLSSRSAMADLQAKVQILKHMEAPLYLTYGGGFRVWLKRIMNVPIRLLSSKQVIYNRDLLTILSLLLNEIEYIRRNALYAANLARHHEQRIAVLEATLKSLQQQSEN